MNQNNKNDHLGLQIQAVGIHFCGILARGHKK